MTLKEDPTQDGVLAPGDVVTDPSGLRAADLASARAYAKDGIIGAPGSEIPGSGTPTERFPAGADHRDPRPATQIEGERLSAEADASDQMKAERESRAPGYAVTGLAASEGSDDTDENQTPTRRTRQAKIKAEDAADSARAKPADDADAAKAKTDDTSDSARAKDTDDKQSAQAAKAAKAS